MTTRREFLEASAALLALDWMGLRHRMGRLPLGFSTLGCPAWKWGQILDFAAEHHFAAVELRGLEATMDLSQAPEFAPERVADARRQLAEHGLRVSDLGASAHMHEMDPAKHAAQLDEARRFIDLAHTLGAPYVRVFGNELVHGVPRDVLLTHIAHALRELGAYAGPKGVTVLIESHGDFTDSPTLLEILRQADSPSVALLWDAHHTFVSGKEAPEDTVRQLGRYIRHTHLKDSVPAGPTGTERRYVLTGTGDVPVRRQVAALARTGYGGYYSFEWEKRWHPEIEAPEIAIAQFATVVSEYLRAAGVPEMSGG
ncbi:MAG TPA: sugar phosphate isomerase/epimerase family protein [Gemmatimonadales bacterium]|nr:sugar phosphate isomerase/epimerase family protein [Gemmatimonadales bacterium]